MTNEITDGENWWKKRAQIPSEMNRYYDKLYGTIDFKISSPILEIGGGSGAFLKYLGIKEATIVDLCGKSFLLEKGYKFITRDLTKSINLKGKYSTIFIMETLEHLRNPLYLMAQVHNLLNEDGVCYISVPYTKLDLQRKDGLNSHVSRWKDKELKKDMEKLGFSLRYILKRRRFKNKAFWLPHCLLVAELKRKF